MELRKVMVFDPYFGGHHLLHLQSILRYWEKYGRGILYVVISKQLLEQLLVNTDQMLVDEGGDGIQFIPISANDQRMIEIPGLQIIRDVVQWYVLRKYANFVGATHCFVSVLDRVIFPMALGMNSTHSFALSGILFRPTINYRNLTFVESSSICKKIRYLQKKIILTRSFRHPNLKVIFSLDPYAVNMLQELAKDKRALRLPEPLLVKGSPQRRPLIWQDLKIEKGRKVFLIFGALSERKGIYTILEAIEYLPIDVAQKTCFLFVGKVDDSESRFSQLVSSLQEISLAQIVLYDKYVSDEEVWEIFKRSDVIMALYRNVHVGSSGILVWASATEKFVLATQFGTVGELVRDIGLGLTADPNNPENVALKICELVEQNDLRINSEKVIAFAKYNTSENFAKVIIDHLE